MIGAALGFRRSILALVVVALSAAPAAAQAFLDAPAVSVRPFASVAVEQFAASDTFKAAFESGRGFFWGGGADLVFHGRVFVGVAASRFEKTGQRAFIDNGEAFRLGIPLTATLTPIELTGGYRFGVDPSGRYIPYAGAGVGWYHYQETSPDAPAGEDTDARHTGFLVLGGLEVRMDRWIGVSLDAQYARVPGILGTGGLSAQAGEDNLGGVAARVRVIVGR